MRRRASLLQRLTRRESRQRRYRVQDLRCKECGQSFRSPSELQDHTERLHGVGKKGGEPIVGNPPSERSR